MSMFEDIWPYREGKEKWGGSWLRGARESGFLVRLFFICEHSGMCVVTRSNPAQKEKLITQARASPNITFPYCTARSIDQCVQ